MKNKITFLAFLGFILLVMGFMGTTTSTKEEGIKFVSYNFEQAKLEAEKTGKLIFIDVYAEWCGPCKLMAQKSFVDRSVGENYNKKFVNLKIDAEKTQDGEDLTRMYAVDAYPTLLFINAKGKLVRKYVGYRSAEELVEIAKIVKP